MLTAIPRLVALWMTIGAAILAASLVSIAAYTQLAVGGNLFDNVFSNFVVAGFGIAAAVSTSVRAIYVARDRTGWALIAFGLTCWAIGTVLWSVVVRDPAATPPVICDILWWLLYPSCYAGVIVMARARVGRVGRGVWLDGVIAALGVSALVASLVFDAVVKSNEGATPLSIATTLSYPVWDLIIAATVTGFVALTGGRPGRRWVFLAAGFLAFTAADIFYVRGIAANTYTPGGAANLLWSTALGLWACAAWQRSGRRRRHISGWQSLSVPALFNFGALGLLVYGTVGDLNLLATLLAVATLLAATLRTAVTYNEVRTLAESRREAVTDELTGLPNRRFFLRDLAAVVSRARERGESAALLVLDLDHFKELNDTLGHAAGDEMLAMMGPRLQGALGGSGRLARLGGDEFAVVLSSPIDAAGAEEVARRVGDAAQGAFDVLGLRVSVGASIGVALFPDHGSTPDELLRRADVAMYQAKGEGRQLAVYAADRDMHSENRLLLATELRAAIAAGAIDVHYQPKADAVTGRITGVEALARWQHAGYGNVSPAEFVSVAEQSGLMGALTRHVLTVALRDCAALEGHVAVNLSAANLLDAALVDDVKAQLAAAGVPPARLLLEITESMVLADPERALEQLRALTELGIGLSLDDFGTGHSSLTNLRRLPVRELKLDRSFVSQMALDPRDSAIVQSTIEMAGRLGLRVVAEGVEDAVTWHMLGALGCDEIQGFTLSRPLPAAQLVGWLAERASGDLAEAA